jgi:hypothetical protein
MFNKGEGGFKDRDLYVFCANISDGMYHSWALSRSGLWLGGYLDSPREIFDIAATRACPGASGRVG